MEKIIRHELFIFFGILIVIGTLLKLFWDFELNSDWFWFLAGLALVTEGTLNFFRQKKFDRKFKVLEREEYERLSRK